MAGLITRLLCGSWEIPDKTPDKPVNLIVGMMLSPDKNGDSSKILDTIIKKRVTKIELNWGEKISFSNRFTLNGKNVAQTARARAIALGVQSQNVVVPTEDPMGAEWISNTFYELVSNIMYLFDCPIKNQLPDMATIGKFVEASIKKRSMLVIANHIHMLRVQEAYKILADKYLKSLASKLEIYWVSAKNYEAYGNDVAQKRFRHPLYFLTYEMCALSYSKREGWA